MRKILGIILLFVFSNGYSNDLEILFLKNGLVDIAKIDSSIKVNLVNSNAKNNFFRENFYDGLQHAYLQGEVAEMLSGAQKIIKKINMDYALLVMDAARPNSISWRMYDKMKGTQFEKYAADPRKGSLHNYGVAVDVTIYDIKTGHFLDMGFTPFYKSDLEMTIQFIKMRTANNKLNKEQVKNRALLKSVMVKAGFIPLGYEWWHFEGLSIEASKQKYIMIN
jgi:zinc D-Ala-D-Ala dipeptidase